MVSELYRDVENKVGQSLVLQGDFVEGIGHKMKTNVAVVERAIYMSCVTTGSRPMEVACIVNEFLNALEDQTRENT